MSAKPSESARELAIAIDAALAYAGYDDAAALIERDREAYAASRVAAAVQEKGKGWVDVELLKFNGELLAWVKKLVDMLDDCINAYDLPGEHCEMEQAIERARDALNAKPGEGE